MKRQIHLLLIFLSAGIVIFGLYFTSGCSPGKQGISKSDAVKLAEQRVQADGVMSLDGRTTEVKEEGNDWHISFPLSSTKVIGGEPHVLIDKASGAITRVYYTQ